MAPKADKLEGRAGLRAHPCHLDQASALCLVLFPLGLCQSPLHRARWPAVPPTLCASLTTPGDYVPQPRMLQREAATREKYSEWPSLGQVSRGGVVSEEKTEVLSPENGFLVPPHLCCVIWDKSLLFLNLHFFLQNGGDTLTLRTVCGIQQVKVCGSPCAVPGSQEMSTFCRLPICAPHSQQEYACGSQ